MPHVLTLADTNLTHWVDKLTAIGPTAFYELTELTPPALAAGPAEYALPMPAALATRLLARAKGKDLNVYKLVLASLGTLLHKYTLHEELLLTTASLLLDEPGVAPAEPGLQLFRLLVAEEDSPKSLLGKIHQEVESNLAQPGFTYAALAAQCPTQPVLATGFYYAPLHAPCPDLAAVAWLCTLTRTDEQFDLTISYQADCYSRRAVALLAQQLLRTLELLLTS